MARNYIQVKLTGDASDLNRALGDAESRIAGFESGMRRIGGGLMAAGAGLTAAVTLPLVAFAKVGFDEMLEADKTFRQTEAVIKSMGGVAGVSASEVSDMAGSLMELSGVDDEIITAGSNILLTFGNIRNGVGIGNDIFDQATESALDMSVALGEDMPEAAMRIGKALNDPIAGVTALRRVGVQLSDQQEEQIKQFMAVGDVASAQKVILGELAREFGGSAEAFGGSNAGKIEKAKRKFEELGAALVEKLLPAIDPIIKAVTKAFEWFGKLPANVQTVIAVVGVLAAALGPALIAIGAVVAAIGSIGLAASAWILVIGAVVAALVGGFMLMWTQSESFRTAVTAMFQEIGNVITAVWSGFIKPVFDAIVRAFREFIQPAIERAAAKWNEAWPGIKQSLQDAWVEIEPIFNGIRDFIVNEMIPAWGQMMGWIIDNVVPGVILSVKLLASAIGSAAGYIRFIVDNIVIPTWNLMRSAFNTVAPPIISLWNRIAGAASYMGGVVTGAAGVFAGAVTSVYNWARDKLGPVVGFFQRVIDVASTLIGKLRDIASAPLGAVGALIGRQTGGTVGAGRPYLVGEFGPEVFVPNSGGTVFPRRDVGSFAGGGDSSITVNLYGSGLTAKDISDEILYAMRTAS